MAAPKQTGGSQVPVVIPVSQKCVLSRGGKVTPPGPRKRSDPNPFRSNEISCIDFICGFGEDPESECGKAKAHLLMPSAFVS